MDYLKITRGKAYYELSVSALKRLSMTKAKGLYNNIPDDIVEKAHIKVNGKPKKKTKTLKEPEKEDKG